MKFNNWTELSFFAAVLLSCYLFAEQLVIAVMAVSKNAYNTSVFSIYVVGVMVVLGSGMLKYVHKSIENTAGIVVFTLKERAPGCKKKVTFSERQILRESDLPHSQYRRRGRRSYSSSERFRRTGERFENTRIIYDIFLHDCRL